MNNPIEGAKRSVKGPSGVEGRGREEGGAGEGGKGRSNGVRVTVSISVRGRVAG